MQEVRDEQAIKQIENERSRAFLTNNYLKYKLIKFSNQMTEIGRKKHMVQLCLVCKRLTLNPKTQMD